MTKENFKLFTLKVIAVAYERWSLRRGSKKCSPRFRSWCFFIQTLFGKVFHPNQRSKELLSSQRVQVILGDSLIVIHRIEVLKVPNVQICPALNDYPHDNHIVSSRPPPSRVKSFQTTHNSVKYEVI